MLVCLPASPFSTPSIHQTNKQTHNPAGWIIRCLQDIRLHCNLGSVAHSPHIAPVHELHRRALRSNDQSKQTAGEHRLLSSTRLRLRPRPQQFHQSTRKRPKGPTGLDNPHPGRSMQTRANLRARRYSKLVTDPTREPGCRALLYRCRRSFLPTRNEHQRNNVHEDFYAGIPTRQDLCIRIVHALLLRRQRDMGGTDHPETSLQR